MAEPPAIGPRRDVDDALEDAAECGRVLIADIPRMQKDPALGMSWFEPLRSQNHIVLVQQRCGSKGSPRRPP